MNKAQVKRLSHAVMFSPSGALIDESLLDRACANLHAIGFTTTEMHQARMRVKRFAGTESARAETIEQAVQTQSPSLLMATRGGYGLSRLLPQLDFSMLALQLNSNGHMLCGHSDITSLQLALLKAGAKPETLLHGPMACFDFGPEQGADALTLEHFQRAVEQSKVNIQWESETLGLPADTDSALFSGPVWGGNLTLLCSLLGTPWLPTIPGGILILEDVNEPAYRIERMLLQLLHAGVLNQQKAIVLGNFCEPKPGIHDNGYTLKSAAEFVHQQLEDIPLFMNFPFGHCTPKACWFQGGQGQLNITAGKVARLTQNLL